MECGDEWSQFSRCGDEYKIKNIPVIRDPASTQYELKQG
jgi:hypothetical protein